MLKINFENLNKLELQILNQLTDFFSNNLKKNISINEAADLCNVSTSKISKAIKKAGFSNYKEFIRFYTTDITAISSDDDFEFEKDRLIDFIKNLDKKIIIDTVSLIEKYEKIVLYGLGPSFICAEYFEYKLRSFTNKMVIATQDSVQLNNILDDKTLLIILSTTGKFSSFDEIISITNNKNGNILMVFEEYSNNIYTNVSNKIFLTSNSQDNSLLPYEKSRILTFIFLEELLLELLKIKKNKNQSH